MSIDYFQCELCGEQVMHGNQSNENKFPVTRRYKDNDREEGLLSVRCQECVTQPYKLEAGQPYRSHMIGDEHVNVLTDMNGRYNCWPYGTGQ
jgi:hypothetical protein